MSENIKPVSLEDLMGGTTPEEPANAPVSPAEPSAENSLTPIRFFTKAGLQEVAALLKQIRTDKTLHLEEVEDLLDDPQYAKPLTGDFAIDRARVFATKLELCEYFTSLFDTAFLEAHRKDSGLWTWLALAYYQQFVKTKKEAVKLTVDSRWIFNADNFQDGRRHYVAGNVYLYQDIRNADHAAMDMFLIAGPTTQFNTITDIMTHVQSGIQSPSVMQVAGWLYYDPKTTAKIKKGSTTDGRMGAARRLTNIVQKLGETWDFHGLEDAKPLWNRLPTEFSAFKGDQKH